MSMGRNALGQGDLYKHIFGIIRNLIEFLCIVWAIAVEASHSCFESDDDSLRYAPFIEWAASFSAKS